MERAAIPAKQTHPRAVTATCLQCSAPVAEGQRFCCSGCEAAHEASPPAPPLHLTDAPATGYFARFALPNSDGSHTLQLAVEGIHCAACIRLIENALYAEEGVTAARVNLSTARLTLTFRGDITRADALAAAVIRLGYRLKPYEPDAQRESMKAEQNFLLRCIAVAGFASGNIMLISVALWATTQEKMGIATHDLFHWLSALIALPAVLYAGRPFFRSAFAVLKERRTNMDVPITIGVLGACTMSLFETFRHGPYVYFDSAVMLLFFLLIGRYLDARAKGKARESAQALLSMLHGTATVLHADGTREPLPIRDLREGMRVLVASGENIPADGVVTEGESDIDTSLVTGETLPQAVRAGDRVFSGTVNLSGPLTVRLSKAGTDSLLSDIIKLMEKAEQGQARYVRLADRAAELYTPVVHLLAALAFFGWWLGAGIAWQQALMIAVTVLIITCPCALGLAVPVVQILASNRLMRRGILLKSGDALEKLSAIDTIAFDKTGTLTLGKPQLIAAEYAPDVIQKAASLAAYSRHPLSRAMSTSYKGELLSLKNVEEVPGKGMQARLDGKLLQLGRREWCSDTNAPASDTALELWFAEEGAAPVRFAFNDALRPDAAQTIAWLESQGLATLLLSGDRESAVTAIAQQAGIRDVYSHLSPVEKCEKLDALQAQKHHVLMVGDGLNDAPSLAAAHVSMSPSSAMDITQNTADIVFQGNSLVPVAEAWKVARIATRLVKENFGLAVIYNLCAIPLALLGYVTPLMAAIAMSSSSLIVIINAFRLNLYRTEQPQ